MECFKAGFLGSATGLILVAVSVSVPPSGEASEVAKSPALAASDQHSHRLELGDGAWPGYRGADRTGVSDEVGLLDNWPERGPRELWRIAEKLWHAPLIDSEINTAILVGEHLYGFKGSILVALEAATGTLTWNARGYGRGSLIAADGKLIVLGENGQLGLMEANPFEHRELSTARALSGRSWTAPSLAAGRLFVRNGEAIASYDLVGETAAPRPASKDASKSR